MKPIYVLNMGFHETRDLFCMEIARVRAHTHTLKNGDVFFSSFILYFFIQEAMSRFAHVLVREKLT